MTELVKRSLVKRPAASAEADGPLRQAQHAIDAFKPGTQKQQAAQLDLIERDYQQVAAKIRIDRERLDECVEEQAQVFLEICERHAQAVSVRDLAKDALAREDAELARDKRMQAIKDSEKVTEKIIDDYVLLHSRHQQAAREFADARRVEMKWSALRDAFDQRMRMLRELVGLYAAGYWTNSGSMQARGQVREQNAERTREALDARRRGG